MSETTQEKLERLRTFRADFRKTISDRIEELQTEKRGMMQEYDLQINGLRSELEQLGFPLPVGNTGNAALADEVLRLLRNNRGRWLSARDINTQLKSSAVLPVVLADYLNTKVILRQGNSYCVMAAEDTGEVSGNHGFETNEIFSEAMSQ